MDPPLAKLKLEALLSEVQVNYEELEPEVKAQVKLLKNAVMQMPEKEVPTSLVKGFLKDLGVPKAKCALAFKRPESLTLVGSYCTRTMVKPAMVVDLALRIPKACFFQKDFLNHRYHAKRALYLAFICKYLRKCESFQSIEWSFFHQDARKPVLVVRPASGSFEIRIFTTISNDVFDVSKLASSKNNVRTEQSEEGVPTPNYNGTILEDIDVEERSILERTSIQSSKQLQEAIMLLKVWLKQRSCYDKADTLNGYLVSMLIIHFNCVGGGQRICNMTSLQTFRVILDIIVKENVLGSAIILQSENAKKQQPPLEAKHADVVIMDAGGLLNMSFRMTKSALAEVKYACERTLAAIKASPEDHAFQEAYMTTLDFAVTFDYQVSVEIASSPSFLNDGAWRTVEERAESVLCTALNNRVKLVRVLRRNFTSGWNPTTAIDAHFDNRMRVGLLLNDYDIAFRMVDVGPSADKKEESTRFRSFWGEKSELRRFRDGSICETAGWECEPWKRHCIIPEICKYVLSRHFSLSKDDVGVVSDQLDFTLLDGSKDSVSFTPTILDALEKFTNRLKGLDLPLKISTVQPLSSACRHTAVFPQRPYNDTAAFIEPLDVMIQLEGSGRWPNDPIAVQKTKVAFCLKIADSAEKQWQVRSVVSEDAADIFMYGFAFRLHLYYEKDATMFQKGGALKADSMTLVVQSMHSSMLNGLHGRFPVYGSTVRLAKRWIGAHLLSDIVSEETTELLVAHLFVHPHPLSPPFNRVNGLLRFLRLLATFSWKFSPLIVDINGDLSAKAREDIMSCFNSARKGQRAETYGGSKDGPAMFVATSYDTESVCWTSVSPSKQGLKRLIAYAKSSQTLLSNIMNGEDTRWQSLFRTPLTCYTAVIQLQKNSLPYPGRVLFPVELNKAAVITSPPLTRPVLNQPVIGFNPVLEFVKELKANFGDIFDVWYDHLGGDIIGVTSKSEAPGSKRKRTATTDLTSTLKQVAELGKGLVYKIFIV